MARRQDFSVGDLVIEGAIKTSTGVGTKNGGTVFVNEKGDGVLHQTVFNLVATPVTITDAPGVIQWGGTAKLYTFPAGLIVTLGAVLSGNLTLGTTGTITATYDGAIAVGTAAAAADATLTATEANIIASTALTQAVAKVAAAKAITSATLLTESGAAWHDGTSTAKELFINVAITDEATHTSGTGSFTGTLTVTWVNLGDA